MEYERKTKLSLEALMEIDFESEYGKLRPRNWGEAMQARHVKQADSAKCLLRSKPCDSERRRYLRHVMEEGAMVIEQFKRKGRYDL